jgi:hypothetical protein
MEKERPASICRIDAANDLASDSVLKSAWLLLDSASVRAGAAMGNGGTPLRETGIVAPPPRLKDQ